MREAHSRPLCESESLFCRRQAWRLPLRGAPRATARRGTGRNQDVRRAHGGVVPRRSLSTLWRCLAGAVGPPPRPRSRRSPCSLVETSPRVASQASLLTICASVFSGIAPLRCFKSQLKRGNRCESEAAAGQTTGRSRGGPPRTCWLAERPPCQCVVCLLCWLALAARFAERG
jgi:hypothetical protein